MKRRAFVVSSALGTVGLGGFNRSLDRHLADSPATPAVAQVVEAARGTTKAIDVTRQEYCPDCRGSGAKKGTVATTCNYCGGQGRVVQSRGFFQVATTCPACGGEGARVPDPCTTCRGTGRTTQVAHLTVHVPAGADSGMWVQKRGEGEPGVKPWAKLKGGQVQKGMSGAPVLNERTGAVIKNRYPCVSTLSTLCGST